MRWGHPGDSYYVLWVRAWQFYHPEARQEEKRKVERGRIPPTVDALDELLAIWIAESMLDG
ncbi:MAG: hypothetical protein QN172_02565 [Armatimonadota bacterium]|nr:hypothetical protein [Armatimonadota bacterium]MDR7439661.1 hypothetical protein [Armatimonadota bacterium]MDR7601323.1 hypothetical protein [Armatimonadota bacterium]